MGKDISNLVLLLETIIDLLYWICFPDTKEYKTRNTKHFQVLISDMTVGLVHKTHLIRGMKLK